MNMKKIKFILTFIFFLIFLKSFSQGSVFVHPIENKIKLGSLSNNRNLGFGIKNIFQEILQDKGYDIVDDEKQSTYIIKSEILYFDINRRKRNVSVFHSDVEETLVIMKGTIYKDGKKIKEIKTEESSSEISTSTILNSTDNTTINQQSLSNAIKKTCEKLITELTK